MACCWRMTARTPPKIRGAAGHNGYFSRTRWIGPRSRLALIEAAALARVGPTRIALTSAQDTIGS